MQDIDFDEIDRAVSSVTNSATDRDVVVPPAPRPVEAAAPIVQPSEPAPAVSSPATRRSTGRFMDVVHSSSDMRPPRSSAPAAASLHRDDVIPDRTAVADRPQPTTVASSAFHWPDPIDVAPVAPVVEPTPEVTPSVAPTPVEAPLPVAPTPPEEVALPLESPFLADAKVEKRPLGAFSGADADLPLLEEPIPFSSNEAASAEIVEPSPDVEALLAETELAEVETEEKEPLLLEEPEVEGLLAETTSPSVAPAPVPVEDMPVGPTSITQQYTEHPSTDAQQSGSIFDTEAYHQPLVHTPKKHSGALVVVWILALILVGGGIGAAVYFVVLPMLG